MKLLKLTNPRILGNVLLHRGTVLSLRFRLALQRSLRLTHEYQPDPFVRELAPGDGSGRPCQDRYNAFVAHLPKGKVLSVLDVGCNRGYFVFRMAERGGFCIGIDSDRNEIMFADALAIVHGVSNVVFTTMVVDRKSVEGLPSVDVTICLSIFHHWVRSYGMEAAKDIMRSIAERTESYLVFETGGPEEEAQWTHELSFMQPDSKSWIKDLLFEIGFRSVNEEGPFSTTVSQVSRTLYIAEK